MPAEIQLLEDFRGLLTDERNATSRTIDSKLAAARRESDAALEEVRKSVRALAERSSRPPGAGALERFETRESLGSEFVRKEGVAHFLRNPQPGGIRIQLDRPVLSARAAPITSANWLTPPTIRPGVVTRPRRRLVLRDVMDVFPLTTQSLIYIIEDAPVPANPGADYQLIEGDVKAQVSISSTEGTCVPSTIAAWVSCSNQVLSDASYLEAYIDNRLVYEVSYVEERELMLGDGGPGKITGLMTVASAYDAARTKGGDTGLDILSHAETQLEELDVYPTAVVINPSDAEGLRLTKTTLGNYVWSPDISNVDEPGGLWGLTIVATNTMPKTQFLVGDFSPSAAQIVEREAAFVSISYEHSDFFTRNLAAIRCEERVGLAIYQPWAYVKGTFPTPALGLAEHAKHVEKK
jgi:HK97 family phage major capsid protein